MRRTQLRFIPTEYGSNIYQCICIRNGDICWRVKEFDLSNLLRSSETVRRTYRKRRNADGSFRIEIEGLHSRESFEAVLVFIDKDGDDDFGGDRKRSNNHASEDWIKSFRRRLVDVQLRKISGASHFELEDMINDAEMEYNNFVKQYGLNADVGAPKWTLDKETVGSSCGVAHFLSELRCAVRIHNRASSATSSSFMSSKYSNDIVMNSDSHELAKALSILVVSNKTNTRTSTRDRLGNHFKIASILTNDDDDPSILTKDTSSPPHVSSRVARAMVKEYESVRHRMKDESHSNTASVNDRVRGLSFILRLLIDRHDARTQVRNVLKETYERAEHDITDRVPPSKTIKTPSKRVQNVLREKYKQAERMYVVFERVDISHITRMITLEYTNSTMTLEHRYGEPPGLEHSVKKAKQRPLEMSDLFQQRDEIEDSSNMEKEYFPDNMFGKSPAKRVTLRRKMDQDLQSEESKYASHLKEELNILDKFRHDATNDAMGRKVRIYDIVEELEIAKEQLNAPEREHDEDNGLVRAHENDDEDEMRSMELLMHAKNNNRHPFDDEDEEEDLTLRPLPRHCVTESFQRVPTPTPKKKKKKHRKRKVKQSAEASRPLLLRSTLVKVLEDASDLLEADFMMLKASETRMSFEDFEDIVSNHVPLDHTSLRELFEISNVDDDGTVNQWEFLNMIRHAKSGKLPVPPSPPASPEIRRGKRNLDLSSENGRTSSLEYRAATGDSEAGQELARRRIRERKRKEKLKKVTRTTTTTTTRKTIQHRGINTPQRRARDRARRVLREKHQKKIDREDEERKREERLRMLEVEAVRAREASWAARRDFSSIQDEEIDSEEPEEVSFEIEEARRRAQQRAKRRVREMKQREQERSQEEKRRRQERFEARDRRLEAFRKRMYDNNEEADEEVHDDDDDDDDADSLDRSVPIKVQHHDFVSPDEDEDEFSSSGIVKLPPPPPSKEDRKAMTPEKSDFDRRAAEMSPLTSTPVPRKSHPRVRFEIENKEFKPRAPIEMNPRVQTHINRRGSVDMVFKY